MTWSKLSGVTGRLPPPSVTHDGEPVSDVYKISFPVPSDAYYQVANSGLLNSPQLVSQYRSVGTRAHLVLALTEAATPEQMLGGVAHQNRRL